jgi:alpha-glucosidase (family GH31 glycosyl hydrolase)
MSSTECDQKKLIVKSLHPDALYDGVYAPETVDVSNYQAVCDERAQVSSDAVGVLANLPSGTVRVDSWAPGVIRLRVSPGHTLPVSPTEELGLIASQRSAGEFEFREEGTMLHFSDECLSLSLNLSTGDIALSDADGKSLLNSREGGVRYEPKGEAADASFYAEFDMGEESFFGGGGRIMPPDRTGTTLDVFSVKTGVRSGDFGGFPLPYFISTKGYGLFLNNPWPHVYFDMGKTTPDKWFLHAPGGPFDLFLIAGPEFSDVITRFTSIVGRISIPPRWLIGFCCSSLGFASAQQAMKDGERLREENYPCDTFIFDGPWRSGNDFITSYSSGHDYPAADLNWHRDFGDGPAMLNHLAELGIKTGLHVNSRVFSPATAEAGIASGVLRRHGEEVVPLVGDAKADAYYASLLAPRIKEGVALWWTDHADRLSGEVAEGLPSRNLFGPLWNRLIASQMPVDDKFCAMSLSRGGGIGSQRYALPWPGDTRCGLDALLDDVWFMINAGLAGFPLTSIDLGGFTVPGCPEDFAGLKERDAQMFTEENIARRLCQAILYVPLPRIHNNWETTAKFPWNCPESLQGVYREALEERYKLTPYWYSYVIQAAETGLPILRPLVYHHGDDAKALACNDEFYVGDWLLMAPAYEEGKVRRSVYLPEGKWTNLWTHESHQGPVTIEVDTPVASLAGVAIFVRAGAILPRQPLTPSLENHLPEALSFDVYPGEDSNFTLREGDALRSELTCVQCTGGYAIRLENKVSIDRPYTLRIHGLEQPTVIDVSEGSLMEGGQSYDAANRIFEVTGLVAAGRALLIQTMQDS